MADCESAPGPAATRGHAYCKPPGGPAARPALRARPSPDRTFGQAMTVMARYGMTVPIDGVILEPDRAGRGDQGNWPGSGYTDVWSSEAMGTDCFVPLAVAAVVEPTLRLGMAIAPASILRAGRPALAQSAATLAATAPGRVVIGIGSSSQLIVEGWNDKPFERPYHRQPATRPGSCAGGLHR